MGPLLQIETLGKEDQIGLNLDDKHTIGVGTKKISSILSDMRAVAKNSRRKGERPGASGSN